jgi:hypothetical protein
VFEMILRRLSTVGLRRGFSGSKPLLYAGIAAVGIRALRRVAHDEDSVLYRTLIQPGDVFEIVTKTPK